MKSLLFQTRRQASDPDLANQNTTSPWPHWFRNGHMTPDGPITLDVRIFAGRIWKDMLSFS